MKTNKKYSKKSIIAIIRRGEPTEIFRLCFHLNGEVSEKSVCELIRNFAPSKKIKDTAYEIAYRSAHKFQPLSSTELSRESEYYEANKIHMIVNRLRYYINGKKDSYTKTPILIEGQLFWASREYGRNDYNKSFICEYKGNEKMCDLLVKLGNKYL